MKKIFGDTEFLQKLILIALPIGLQTAVNMFVNLIDTIMVGKLGDIALSSVNISSQFPYLYMTVIMGLSNAGMIIAAQAFGNGRTDLVKSMTAFCFKLCIIVNAIFFSLAFLFPGTIISIYTNNPGIIETGAVYLKVLSICFLFQSFPLLFVTLLRSIGEANIGFISSLFACFANVFFNWVFIFGNLGFPALGVLGAAVGTVMARITELIVVLVYLAKDKILRFRPKDLSLGLTKEVRQDYIRIGTPSIISEVTTNLNVSAAAWHRKRCQHHHWPHDWCQRIRQSQRSLWLHHPHSPLHWYSRSHSHPSHCPNHYLILQCLRDDNPHRSKAKKRRIRCHDLQ